jgi:hypothetical protein
MGHTLIYFFESKKKELPLQKNINKLSVLTDSEIALHTHLIRGINKDIAPQVINDWLEKDLEEK